ncbi:uncharacterized protein LOC142357675 isoform X2 [Convolutriloba macropyga]|uniref:uncharacterized protein LOC142357675 isoform X2 n=1 Tax=Convolutriloba macropyga TaxID=536237 RepID=UPI003F528333
MYSLPGFCCSKLAAETQCICKHNESLYQNLRNTLIDSDFHDENDRKKSKLDLKQDDFTIGDSKQDPPAIHRTNQRSSHQFQRRNKDSKSDNIQPSFEHLDSRVYMRQYRNQKMIKFIQQREINKQDNDCNFHHRHELSRIFSMKEESRGRAKSAKIRPNSASDEKVLSSSIASLLSSHEDLKATVKEPEEMSLFDILPTRYKELRKTDNSAHNTNNKELQERLGFTDGAVIYYARETHNDNDGFNHLASSKKAFSRYPVKRDLRRHSEVHTQKSMSYCSVSPFQTPLVARQLNELPLYSQTQSTSNHKTDIYLHSTDKNLRKRTDYNYPKAIKHYVIRPQTTPKLFL